MKLKVFLQVCLWVFPWPVRRFIYKKVFGFKLAPGAYIGRSIVLAKYVELGRMSAIRNLNVIKNIDEVILGDYSYLLNFNWITGTPSNDCKYFKHVQNRRCCIQIGSHSSITSRHFIDCTGGVYVGRFTTVGGGQSQFLTHFIDPYECRQTCKSIKIGDYCFVGTKVLILPGGQLPDYSILGGGSVLTKSFDEKRMLYAGNPALAKKSLEGLDVKYFSRSIGAVE